MGRTLKITGLVFAGVFLIGYFVNIIVGLVRHDELSYMLFSGNQKIIIASITMFLLSAFVPSLRWFQPAVFFVTSPMTIIDNPESIYGLGYFIMGCVLLERAGFFIKRRAVKILILIVALLATEIAALIFEKKNIIVAAEPTFFILAFGLFLWFLYKDRLVVFLKEPKGRLSLSERGLSNSEIAYVKALISGMGVKEIGVEYDVAESTVRNTLSHAYKKLAVESQGGMFVLAEKYDLVD